MNSNIMIKFSGKIMLLLFCLVFLLSNLSNAKEISSEEKRVIVVFEEESVTSYNISSQSQNRIITHSISNNSKNDNINNNNKLKKEMLIQDIGKDKIKHKFNTLNGFSASLTEDEIKKLKQKYDIKEIKEVGLKKPFLTESVPLINATSTWNLVSSSTNLTGSGQTVCVIDTGVNYSHPDIGGGIGTGYKVIGGYNTAESHDDPMDYDGHGTHVAGIISADGVLKGVAPDSNIIAINSYNETAEGFYDDDLIAGIEWCINNASKFNISVISMSLGGGLFDENCDNVEGESDLAIPINNATENGIAVIVASGNDANHTHIASPACVSTAIPVGMTYDSNIGGISWGDSITCTDSSTLQDKIVCSSNRNQLVQLFAPGALINSTWYNGNYYLTGGTSMATPHVAGAYAIMNQYLDSNSVTKTPHQIENIFNSTGKQIYDDDSKLNYSRIDIFNAIENLDMEAPSITLNSPENSSSFTTTEITLNFTATDNIANSMDCLIYDNGVNIYNTTADNDIATTNNTNFAQGLHTWYVTCIDNMGNSNTSETRTFTVDTLGPSCIDITQSPQLYNEDKNYTFNVTCNDTTEIDTVNLNFSSSLYEMASSTVNSFYITSSSTFTIASNTIYNYNFWANDTLGNENTTSSSTFRVISTSASQTLATTPSYSVASGTSEIIVPMNSILQNVTVDSDQDVFLNMSYLVSTSTVSTVTLPNYFNLVRESTVNYSAYIPANTTITAPLSWDNAIYLPKINQGTYTAPSGETKIVVDMGSTVELNFSQPVKITIGDMAGKRAAWTREDTTLIDISTECNNKTAPTNIDNSTTRECYIDDGNDLLIWTYHFTDFAAYQPETNININPTGGGGGGGSATTVKECVSYWKCSAWSDCINTYKRRECVDYNNCSEPTEKPSERESCSISTLPDRRKFESSQNIDDNPEKGTKDENVSKDFIEDKINDKIENNDKSLFSFSILFSIVALVSFILVAVIILAVKKHKDN